MNQQIGKEKVKVLVQFIQDRSGSMATIWDETRNGFKSFVEGLQKNVDDVEYLFTLTTFDTLIEMPIKEQPIKSVDLNELAKHGPRGATALYDAVGKTLEGTKTVVDKCICVIVTDGQENSSREWSKAALNSAIDAKIKLGNWTFTYLGTQPETWSDASSIGIGAGATVAYDPAKIHDTYRMMSQAVATFSTSNCLGTDNLMKNYADQDELKNVSAKSTTWR